MALALAFATLLAGCEGPGASVTLDATYRLGDCQQSISERDYPEVQILSPEVTDSGGLWLVRIRAAASSTSRRQEWTFRIAEPADLAADAAQVTSWTARLTSAVDGATVAEPATAAWRLDDACGEPAAGWLGGTVEVEIDRSAAPDEITLTFEGSGDDTLRGGALDAALVRLHGAVGNGVPDTMFEAPPPPRAMRPR
jgi:hypothetical protein